MSVTDIALRIGKSRATIHTWERSAVVMPDSAAEYRAALVALRDAREAALG